MSGLKKDSVVVWRLTDGKPGHEKQSLGLVHALNQQMPCDCYDIAVKPQIETWINYLGNVWPQGNRLPSPDYIVGAGHNTHLHILAAKKAFGGKSVVLMQPSLPVGLFDVALVPEHDEYRGTGPVIETRGVLNALSPAGEHDQHRALIMIGGVSKHFDWDSEQVIAQIEGLLVNHPNMQFTLTTSRRTPVVFLQALYARNLARLTICPIETTEQGWVEAQLAASAYAWITEDSVSMVYEALTAQVAVGLINLKKTKESRVANGVQKLIEKHMAVRFDAQGLYQKNMHALHGFREANRCAKMMVEALRSNSPVVTRPIFA